MMTKENKEELIEKESTSSRKNMSRNLKGKLKGALISLGLSKGKKEKISFRDTHMYKELKSKYDQVYQLSENFIGVKLGDKRGLVNSKGEMLLEPEYQDIVNLGRNRVKAEFEGKWGVIDEKGNIILNFEYDGIDLASSDYNALIVEKNGKSELVSMITGERDMYNERN